METTTALVWLLLTPMVSAPIVYIIGRIVNRYEGEKKIVNPSRLLALFSLLCTSFFLFLCGKGLYETGQSIYLNVGEIWMRFDGVSLLLSILVLLLGMLVTVFSFTYMSNEVGEEKFYALLILMIGAIIGLGCALDLFNLWVWFEAMAISSIFLVTFYRNQSASLEAGLKYLVQSAIGSVLVVIGISFILMHVGKLNIETIRMSIQQPSALLYSGGALILIGFGVKTALVPLHTWLPDAHSQAPSGISAMLSGVVIEAGLIAILRVVGGLALTGQIWGYILLGFGGLNMLVGNLMALRQREVKRLLAYSSISHVGYMLLGFGTMIVFSSLQGAMGGSFHLFTHGLMKTLAFLAAGALLFNLHIARGDHNPLILDDLNGASQKYPLVSFAFSVAVLALGGLPPLAGFMSKWQIFVSGAQTQNTWMLILVLFAALNSVLSLGYYAPLVNRLYRKQTSTLVENGEKQSFWMSLPMVILIVLITVIGFAPSITYWITGPAGISLFMFFSR